MRDHIIRLAGYNRWANARLYEAAATLDENAYFKDRKAFFTSIHGTLGQTGMTPPELDPIYYLREVED